MAVKGEVKVGVIGAGGIAAHQHLPSLSLIEGARVAAVCDIVEERAAQQAEKHSVPKTYTLYKKMLAEEDLDCVFVLVEPSNLFRVVVDCLEAGLHTFMEKPPGVTSFQAEGMARAAEKAGRILQVGFNRRYIPLVRKAVEIMREATTVSQVAGRFMKCGKAAFDKGGLSAFPSDTIHVVDLVRWIANGEPVKAATVIGRANDVVDNAWNSVVKFDNGVNAVVQANYQTGGRMHDFEIHGPGASAFINLGFGTQGCDAKFLFAKGESGYSISAAGAGKHDVQTLDGKELAGSGEYFRYYGYFQEDEDFLSCVREGRQPEASIQEAAKSFRLVDMILQGAI